MTKLATDLGENYEYLRIIATSKLELKKLELVDTAGTSLGLVVTMLLVFLFSLCGVIFLMVLIGIYLSYLLQSDIQAVAMLTGISFGIALCIYMLREKLIISPISRILYKTVESKI